ncbi:enoyl-CoA hydratase/isomerase family protein [Nannocystis sp.]|uniref:enoyl-CoA hydratase/isomerase family protein n=1 Tax=Nannocystis sp. TaxID=1962667 RepID=UPI0025D36EF3|nr:enoyl-CoA hydratase/isomerase family protein [Nannocystis sp.]MBK7828927.1 enoyl-CoA hydratase/isomerase family protein [Nannocystis sp.]
MCWGYGWQQGPFALMDAAGVAWCAAQLSAMGLEPAPALRELVAAQGDAARWYAGRPSAPTIFVPGAGARAIPTPAGMISLAAAKDARGELHSNKTASLIDIGDGIACLGVPRQDRRPRRRRRDHARRGPPDPRPHRRRRGLVIGNQGDNFCAGADLRTVLAAAEARNFVALERAVAALQTALMDLRHGELPVVVAPHGLTLGGGVEVTLHGDAIVANRIYMGLVEIGVGLLPAGGGLKRLPAARAAAPRPEGRPLPLHPPRLRAPPPARSRQAPNRTLGFPHPGDTVVFHRARVVAEAKRRAVGLAEAGYVPPDRNAAISLISTGRGELPLVRRRYPAAGPARHGARPEDRGQGSPTCSRRRHLRCAARSTSPTDPSSSGARLSVSWSPDPNAATRISTLGGKPLRN